MQGRWARQRQALFIAAHVFNPALRYEGLNMRCPSTTMMTQINALVQLYRAVLGSDLDPAVLHNRCTDLVTQWRALCSVTCSIGLTLSNIGLH